MYKIVTLAVLLGLTAQPALALSVDTGIDAAIKANSDADASVTLESNTTTSADANAQAEADATIGVNAGPIVITASDTDDTEVSVDSAVKVNSATTLHSYARGIVKADADIKDVSLSDSEVAVSHKEHARLFGILPIKVYARAHIKNDGSVQVKYPWYAFATAEKASLESRVSAAVRAHLPSPSASASASAKLSAKTQAEVLEKAVAAMKAEMDATASAKAAAKVQ
jgi:hypothetical protein